MPLVNCTICKIKFKVDKNVLDKGKGKYCSQPCFTKGRKKPKRVSCENCGKLFNTYPYLLKKNCGKYCSLECNAQSKITRFEKKCQYCGNKFEVEPNTIKIGKGRYCSQSCGAKGTVESPIVRFIEKIIVIPGPDACWIWTGARQPEKTGRPYGKFLIDNRCIQAHRFSYEYFRGPLGELFACHTCDRPICVAPHHLFASDAKGNSTDAVLKERNRKSLTKKQVIEILNSPYESGYSLAKKYKVSTTIIYYIRSGKTYKHIPRPQYP